MSLRFYLGGSGHGKSSQLHKDIVALAKENPNTNFLFIVPDQFTMQTQFDLVKASPGGGIMNIDVLSISRLAYRVFEETGYGKKPVLDDTGKSLILRRIASTVKDDMPFLGKNINKVGYIHEIKSVISELKQYDIDDDKLSALIDYSANKNLLCSKLQDIRLIFDAFNDYTRNEYITTEESVSLLAEAIFHSRIVKDAYVVFDGFTGFTPVQYRLIEGLLQLTKEVIVSLTLDIDANPYKEPKEHELFYLTKKTLYDLQKIAAGVNVKIADDIQLKEAFRFANNPELRHLEKYLFRFPADPFTEKNSVDNIQITECYDIPSEVRDVCVRIKKLALDGEYEYRDMAVCCANLESYADEFRKMALIYDLPIFIDQNSKILLNPFIEYIKSGLNVIKENFSYSSVFHFLRCGVAPFTDEETDIFDNYVLSYGIKGAKQYTDIFTAVKPNKKGENISAEDVEMLAQINNLRERFINTMHPLMQKNDTVSDYVKAIYEFIDSESMESKLDVYSKMFLASKDAKRAGEYSQVMRVVHDLLDEFSNLLGNISMGIDEFIKTLESGFDEIDVGTIPLGVDALLVGDIERSRLGRIKVLFFLGVNDGNIPKNNSKGGIINDMDREYLKSSEIALSPTPREQMYTQRMYLYMNLTKPSDKLFISYSRTSLDLKPLNPSYLIGTIKKLFPQLATALPETALNPYENILGPTDALMLLSDGIRDYAGKVSGGISKDELGALYGVLSNNQSSAAMSRKIVDSAFFEYKEEPLSKELSLKLYGEILKNSVTRLEKFAMCQYSHFLTYGLKLSEREEMKFERKDLGNVYHDVLEEFSKDITNSGRTLVDFDDDEALTIVDKVCESVSASYGRNILYRSRKNEFMLGRIKKIMHRTVCTLRDQLKKGAFVPAGFEIPFSENFKLDDAELFVTGRIDRMDIATTDDTVYVKIIDYKSGKRTLELSNLFEGISLQQPLYMAEALKKVSEKYPELMPKMAAMLYYRVDAPLVEKQGAESFDDVREEFIKANRPNGLIVNDDTAVNMLDETLAEGSTKSIAVPLETNKDGSYSKASLKNLISEEDYSVISQYTMKKMARMGSEIMAGNIKINPVKDENNDACAYCPYSAICRFDFKDKGFTTRKIQKVEKDEAIERMKECL